MWTLPTEQGRLLLICPSEGYPIGASDDSGEGLLTNLMGLVRWGAKGTGGIYLIDIEESGQGVNAQCLFCVSTGDYT